MNTEEFSEWIVDELEQHDMTAWDLAKKLGVSYNLVKMYIIEERTPTLKTFWKLLEVFGKKVMIVDK